MPVLNRVAQRPRLLRKRSILALLHYVLNPIFGPSALVQSELQWQRMMLFSWEFNSYSGVSSILTHLRPRPHIHFCDTLFLFYFWRRAPPFALILSRPQSHDTSLLKHILCLGGFWLHIATAAFLTDDCFLHVCFIVLFLGARLYAGRSRPCSVVAHIDVFLQRAGEQMELMVGGS